ncbi:MAG: GNAT family N-acetyltransferase [Promethearchaeota archaeon]
MMIVPGFKDDIIDLMRVQMNAFKTDGYDILTLGKLISHSLVFLKLVDPTDMHIIGYSICSNLMGEDDVKTTQAADLITLAIHKKYQGNGFGKKLLKQTLLELQKFHVKLVQLHVKTTNEVGIHIYEKFGFRILETRPHFYDESKDSAYRMILRMDNPKWKNQV